MLEEMFVLILHKEMCDLADSKEEMRVENEVLWALVILVEMLGEMMILAEKVTLVEMVLQVDMIILVETVSR